MRPMPNIDATTGEPIEPADRPGNLPSINVPASAPPEQPGPGGRTSRPSIGRIVHYHHAQEGCLAGVVVLVHDDGQMIAMERFMHPHQPGGLLPSVRRGQPGEPDTWHFPERV